jgi:N-acetyl-gamma-glutamyl-phosphate reductase
LPKQPLLSDVHAALARAYDSARFVDVVSLAECAAIKTLDPEGLNGTNRLKIFAFGDDKTGQARLVVLLDNLGKGASGAAVQNLNIMCGLDEGLGLI